MVPAIGAQLSQADSDIALLRMEGEKVSFTEGQSCQVSGLDHPYNREQAGSSSWVSGEVEWELDVEYPIQVVYK